MGNEKKKVVYKCWCNPFHKKEFDEEPNTIPTCCGRPMKKK
jgi:hypothetical protein